MNRLAKLRAKIRATLNRGRSDADMAAEMAIHIEHCVERNIKAGMTDDAARYEALREFGNVLKIKETSREARGWVWIEVAARDVSFACRSLRKSPGLSLIVMSVLALGIGCNTALFTVVDALMLHRLPVKEPDQLVIVVSSGAIEPNKDFPYALFDHTGINRAFPFSFYESFRDNSRALSDIVAVGGWMMPRPMVAKGFGSSEVESVDAEEVSGNYFTALGVTAFLGRTLGIADDNIATTDTCRGHQLRLLEESLRCRFLGDRKDSET